MSIAVSLGGAALIALAHGATHYAAGSEDSFAEAGVRPAGLAVFVASFAVLFVLTST